MYPDVAVTDPCIVTFPEESILNLLLAIVSVPPLLICRFPPVPTIILPSDTMLNFPSAFIFRFESAFKLIEPLALKLMDELELRSIEEPASKSILPLDFTLNFAFELMLILPLAFTFRPAPELMLMAPPEATAMLFPDAIAMPFLSIRTAELPTFEPIRIWLLLRMYMWFVEPSVRSPLSMVSPDVDTLGTDVVPLTIFVAVSKALFALWQEYVIPF